MNVLSSIKVILCIGFDIVVTVIELENGTKRLVQLCPEFKPGMTHQIFENEKITGVQNPHVDIYFNPSTGDVASLRVFNCRCVYM